MKLSLIVLMPATASGFAFDLFSAFRPNPSLGVLTEAQNHKQFDVKFDIDNDVKEGNHFYLNGLGIELLDEAAKKTIGLPGADGPNKQTSR